MSIFGGIWPLFGRERLLADLRATIDSGTHVVLSAVAGAGKTRVADELLRVYRATGVITGRVVASPASPLPLAPFSLLLDGRTDGDPVTGVLDALEATGRSGAGEPVLLVDDVHLLDDASSVVVHQLATSGRVRIIATMRTATELPPAIARLRREPTVRTIDVPPLSDDDIAAMAEHAIDGRLDGRSRLLLTTSAAGNPLYAKELVIGSIASGALRERVGVWGFEGELAATPALAEVVQARLAPLDAGSRDAMELLAIGGPLDESILSALAGHGSVEELERTEVIVADVGARTAIADLAHPLYRELTRMRLGPLARRRIYGRLAAAVADQPANDSGTPDRLAELRTVVWQVRAGAALASDRLLAAAQQANAAGDPKLAAELSVAAFERSGDAKAALVASWTLSVTGRRDEGIDVLRAAIGTGRAEGTSAWELTAMQLRIAEELWWTGRTDQGIGELSAPVAEGVGPWADLLIAQRGVFASLDGRVTEALETAEPLLDHPHLWVRFVAAVAVGSALTFSDDAAGSLRTSTAILADIEGQDDALLGDAGIHFAIQMTAMIYGGQCIDGLAVAELAYAASIDRPSVQARAWTAMIRGLGLATTGRNLEATRYYAEAESLWAGNGLEGMASWSAAGLALSQAALGASDEVADTVARLDGYRCDGFRLYEPIAHTARAWSALMSGDGQDAAKHLERALAGCVEHGHTTHRYEVGMHAARLGMTEVIADVASWPVPIGDLSAAQWHFAVAVVADDAAALEAAADRLESLGALLYAAEAQALAAASHRRFGTARDALRCDGRAGALLERCGGASTPPLAGRTSGGGPLSARESEIARLVASGMTNRQVADQLIVSERTVENHLYRSFAKLGITARDQIDAALRAHG